MGFFDFVSDVVGNLTGGSSSSDRGSTGDQARTQEPWPGLQPFVLEALRYNADLFNSGGPEYYPGSTVVPFSPQSQLGMEMLQNRALQGSPYQNAAGNFVLNTLNGTNANPATDYLQGFANNTVDPMRVMPASFDAARMGPYEQMDAASVRDVRNMDAANVRDVRNMQAATVNPNRQVQVGDGLTGLTRQTFNQTMRGNYLNSNPYLDQTFNRASDAVTRQWNESVLPGVNSTFSLAGRTGSGAHQNAVNQASEQLGDTLSDLGNQIYGQNYQQERDRMMQAANSLGGFDTTEQGYGLQASTSNASNALQRNMQNAQFQQNANQFNVGFDQNRALQDAGYQQQANQFNVGFDQNRALQDAGYQQQANLTNSDRSFDASQFNAANRQATNAANAGFRQDARTQNAANDLSAQTFNQNYGLNMGNLMNHMYQQNFNNQNVAANLGMDLGNQDYFDIGQLLNIGQMVEGKAGETIQDQMNRFNFYQNAPETNFNAYLQRLASIPGSGFTNTNINSDMDQGSAFADWVTGLLRSRGGDMLGNLGLGGP